MAGHDETEIKLRMPGPGPAREAVAGLGATLVRPRHFEDNLLLDDAASSLVGSGRTLRLRRTSDAAVTKPDTKPKPSLLALLEDDIRQSLGALSAELNRLRGKIRPSLERHQDEGVTTSASPESVKGPDR